MRLHTIAFLTAALALDPASMAADGDAGVPSGAVLHIGFSGEESLSMVKHGAISRDLSGPRPPEFPDFDEGNLAARFDGNGARIEIGDPGAGSVFDFTNGDAITLEAWVDAAESAEGTNRYVIGKGRTHAPGFARDNQNWALRLRGVDGEARVSFLFATPPAAGAPTWHRWTSGSGFRPDSGWHHIAVTYVFGQPGSLAGWIDGARVGGSWDMGGATDCPPVTDDAPVWIGSSMGGNADSSLIGMLDEVALHRRILPDDELSGRFRRTGPPREAIAPTAPETGDIPPGTVLAMLAEGLRSHTKWPEEGDASPVATVSLPDFHLHRMPFRYDEWGIRDSWKAPAMATLAAEVSLPPGPRKLAVRTRGLSRLWVNGELVLTTRPHSGSTDGHGPVLPLPDPPAPGLAPVGYGDHEYLADVHIPENGRARIILEAIIGGKNLRPEPGEMCILVADGPTFRLLSPDGPGAEATPGALRLKREATEALLHACDTRTRLAAAATQDAFWQMRHAAARSHVEQRSFSRNSIDAFLAARIADAEAAAADSDPELASHVHDTVLPILSTHCFRCHGDKKKGGLRLDSRAEALAALAPGRPGASELIHRIATDDADERMPPEGERLSATEEATLREWIAVGAPWPAPPLPHAVTSPAPLVNDAAFARRAYFDTIGIPPSEAEARAFLADPDPDKRTKLVDRLLADGRFADHWVSHWQDVLAENPSMLKPSLNNSGPFRWFLHEALRDNKPVDRLVTELVLLRGSEREGGSAGFGLATDNDSPFAEKAHILGTAFLGIESQCARCHDSPYHSTTQRDLYSIAAMLQREPLAVPESSTVPPGFFAGKGDRESLIRVTLPPGEPVEPAWPFPETSGLADPDAVDALVQAPGDWRSRLAAHITSAHNVRFAPVLVNRLWKRLIGAGIVEPVHDWEGRQASHPELLDWLATQLIRSGYDQKHVLRLIMTSDAYAKAATGDNLAAEPQRRFFAAPERRRLSAEQVVDALYAASGLRMDVEELTFDPDGRRPATTMLSLGFPRRAWEFASLSNERDRPSLALPKAQAVTDVLEAFGWVSARQGPVHARESAPNVLQPGALANGTLATWISRAGDGSPLAELALAAASPEALVDSLFLRFLTRLPGPAERRAAVSLLEDGFSNRRVPDAEVVPNTPPEPLRRVSWTNHLHPDANRLKLVMEQRARDGAPPDPRLRADWRERLEDVVWSLFNAPEFPWLP